MSKKEEEKWTGKIYGVISIHGFFEDGVAEGLRKKIVEGLDKKALSHIIAVKVCRSTHTEIDNGKHVPHLDIRSEGKILFFRIISALVAAKINESVFGTPEAIFISVDELATGEWEDRLG
jgi:hypothetical protein